jgi:hypothetical protein
MTPDKSKLVRLHEDAASVVVTNPTTISVLLDSPRLLVILPRLPGTTTFTVLNSGGKIIMERTVIVATAAQPKYVRIRKLCQGGDPNCVRSAYFYCPDGCYEVLPVNPEASAAQAPPISGSNGDTSGQNNANTNSGPAVVTPRPANAPPNTK